MQKAPMVSILIMTYNRDDMVGQAIQSVLGQTYQDFELIVVDDGATDNTEKVVRSPLTTTVFATFAMTRIVASQRHEIRGLRLPEANTLQF